MCTYFVCFCKFNSFRLSFIKCLNQMSCNRGKIDGKTQKSNIKCLFPQKYFWSEPKTFASFSGVLFLEKHEGNKRRYKKNLIKNFKFLLLFSFCPNFTSCHFNFQLEMMQKHFYKVEYFSFVLEYCLGAF